MGIQRVLSEIDWGKPFEILVAGVFLGVLGLMYLAVGYMMMRIVLWPAWWALGVLDWTVPPGAKKGLEIGMTVIAALWYLVAQDRERETKRKRERAAAEARELRSQTCPRCSAGQGVSPPSAVVAAAPSSAPVPAPSPPSRPAFASARSARDQRERATDDPGPSVGWRLDCSAPRFRSTSGGTADEAQKPEEAPLPPGLTASQWLTYDDPLALLAHALPRIPLRYTCLVMAQLAETTWPAWHARVPEDWRPAWCLTTLRAWCFGQATAEEVGAARARLLKTVLSRETKLRRSPRVITAATIEAVRQASLYPGFEGATEVSLEPARRLLSALGAIEQMRDPLATAAEEASRWASDQQAPINRLWGKLSHRTLSRAEGEARDRLFASLAAQLREWIPYPERKSRAWLARGNVLCAGDALVSLDGWRIRSAIPIDWKPRYPRGGWI